MLSRVLRKVWQITSEHAGRVARQRRLAKRQVRKLLSKGRDEAWRCIQQGNGAMWTRPVVEELLRRCKAVWHEDPHEGKHLAELAVYAATWTPIKQPETAGERGWNDTRAWAMAYLANTHRLLCSWEESHQEFRRAYLAMEEGTGDLELGSCIHFHHASLLWNRSMPLEALALLVSSEEAYRSLGDRSALGATLQKKALILRDLGNTTGAIKALYEACELLDTTAAPLPAASAAVNLALLWTTTGRHREALITLEDAMENVEACGDGSSVECSTLWVRGMAAYGLSALDSAESDFRQAMAGYRSLEDPYDEGLVGLELCKVLATQGRLEELFPLAQKAHELLSSQDLHPEASETLALLENAIRERVLGVELLQKIGETLKKSWELPEVRR